MQVLALLTIRRAELALFRDYEHHAARIMARYGGELEAFELAGDDDTLRELHVVRFPDDAAFAAYRADPDLAARAADRARAVLTTEIWPAKLLPRYGG